MATLDEIAQGVVMMMEFSGLDIVPIEFRNHSPEEFSAFIKRVVELCNSGGIVLASVRLIVKRLSARFKADAAR